MRIIGLAGTNGSGKDTVAAMLVERHGFYFASASHMLGDELDKRGLSHEREHKRMVSTEWRERFGLGAIVDKAMEAAESNDINKLVVGSLRNPGEADRVHELGGVVVWVDADPRVRYERISRNIRGRVEDNKTFEEFLAEEEAEMQSTGNANALNGAAVKERADIFLSNDGSDIAEFMDAAETELSEYV